MAANHPRFPDSLLGRLTLVAVVSIVPVALAAGVAIVALVDGQREAGKQKSLEVTRLAASAIEVELQRNLASLRTLTLSPMLDRVDLVSYAVLLDRFRQEMPAWQAAGLLTSDGRFLLKTDVRPGDPMPELAEPESFHRAVETRTAVIGKLIKRPNGKWGVAMRAPVIRQGQLIYVVTAVVSPESFQDVVELQGLPLDWTLSVFDAQGSRVARSRDPQKWLGQPASPTLAQLMAGDRPSGTGKTLTLEGSQGFTAYVRLPESRWSVAISIPMDTILAGASRAFTVYGGGALLSILVAMIAAALMAKRVTQPILELRAAAEQLGAGERPTLPGTHIPEIASLGTSIVAAGDLLREERRVLELLNQTGSKLASTLELKDLLQAVTDAGTELSGAQFGAFFYNTTDEKGDAYLLYTLSGAPVEAFEKFGQPRATPIFAPTFRGGQTIRCDDVTADPRYGQWAPHRGMPEGHLPVRSYLAASVVSRTGDVIGGLFFGHATPGVFTARAERLISGLAAQAAVAVDNARLYERSRQSAAERAQLLDSERAARAQSERESAIKDEFLATLSHELRTPLSAIIGWAQVLRRKECGDAERIKGVETIERNARAQAQLIDDLLDMSRVIAGKLRLDVQSVMAHAFTEAAIETVRPAAAAKNIRLEVTLDPGAGPVTGDAARLQQVIWNLLSNAIKFTPSGGKVQVVVQRVASQVEICVADTGIGIGEQFLSRVFERFRQADSSTTRRHGGLGLGLAICKQLVELHGGTIEASSLGENQGATFSVRLPLTVIHRARPDDTPHPRAMPMLSAAFQPIDLSGTRVLVVDDDRDARELANRLLEECKATVDLAGSAIEALRLVKERRPDVLVTDIGMPEMDGYELLRQVRLLEGDTKIPAIALTAFARSEDRTRALRAGFLVHVAKPVEPTELVAAVAAVAGRAPGPTDAT